MAGKDTSVMESVEKAIKKTSARLAEPDVKLGIADLVRLLQLKKELAANEVGAVMVGWVETDHGQEPAFAE